MKKKLSLVMIAVLIAIMLLGACSSGSGGSGSSTGKQTATAWIEGNDAQASAIVDLHGGWSVEFSQGAIYLYKGEANEGADATAMLVTLDQEVYDEDYAAYKDSESFKEEDGKAYYVTEDGHQHYLYVIENLLPVDIDIQEGENAEEILNRFSFEYVVEFVESPDYEQILSIANPWSEADSSAAAAVGAGIDEFNPAEGAEISLGTVTPEVYRFMDGVAEARIPIAAVEMTIRKGRIDSANEAGDISGDYNEYKNSWTEDIDGTEVKCFGNREGESTKTIWQAGDYYYSITAYGAGGDTDYGLKLEDLTILVNGLK